MAHWPNGKSYFSWLQWCLTDAASVLSQHYWRQSAVEVLARKGYNLCQRSLEGFCEKYRHSATFERKGEKTTKLFLFVNILICEHVHCMYCRGHERQPWNQAGGSFTSWVQGEALWGVTMKLQQAWCCCIWTTIPVNYKEPSSSSEERPFCIYVLYLPMSFSLSPHHSVWPFYSGPSQVFWGV